MTIDKIRGVAGYNQILLNALEAQNSSVEQLCDDLGVPESSIRGYLGRHAVPLSEIEEKLGAEVDASGLPEEFGFQKAIRQAVKPGLEKFAVSLNLSSEAPEKFSAASKAFVAISAFFHTCGLLSEENADRVKQCVSEGDLCEVASSFFLESTGVVGDVSLQLWKALLNSQGATLEEQVVASVFNVVRGERKGADQAKEVEEEDEEDTLEGGAFAEMDDEASDDDEEDEEEENESEDDEEEEEEDEEVDPESVAARLAENKEGDDGDDLVLGPSDAPDLLSFLAEDDGRAAIIKARKEAREAILGAGKRKKAVLQRQAMEARIRAVDLVEVLLKKGGHVKEALSLAKMCMGGMQKVTPECSLLLTKVEKVLTVWVNKKSLKALSAEEAKEEAESFLRFIKEEAKLGEGVHFLAARILSDLLAQCSLTDSVGDLLRQWLEGTWKVRPDFFFALKAWALLPPLVSFPLPLPDKKRLLGFADILVVALREANVPEEDEKKREERQRAEEGLLRNAREVQAALEKEMQEKDLSKAKKKTIKEALSRLSSALSKYLKKHGAKKQEEEDVEARRERKRQLKREKLEQKIARKEALKKETLEKEGGEKEEKKEEKKEGKKEETSGKLKEVKGGKRKSDEGAQKENPKKKAKKVRKN